MENSRYSLLDRIFKRGVFGTLFLVLLLVGGLSGAIIVLVANGVFSANFSISSGVGVGILMAIISFSVTKILITKKLDAVINMTKAVLSNDMSQRCELESQDVFGDIANAMNKLADDMQYNIGLVGEAATRLGENASRVGVVSDETERCLQTQQMSTNHVVTAMQEMTATAKEVAINGEQADQSIADAAKEATAGAAVASNALGGMNTLIDKVKKATIVVTEMHEDSQNIGQVLEVIRGIAEQTNLLALNAAIEAARAGEQGRGFAVVADEVRTLASRTQTSTDEIQKMIERLQSRSNDVSTVMQGVFEAGTVCEEQVVLTSTAIDELAGSFSTLRELNKQVSSAVSQQSLVAEEINLDMIKISDATEETAAGSQQTKSASEDLERQVLALKEVVQRFGF